MTKKIIRIGFDLDGVILYSLARLARPFVSAFKRFLLKKKRLKFFIPKSNFQRWYWRLFHKSSIFVATGFKELIALTKRKDIEIYLITSRFDFLKDDFLGWLNKIEAQKYFKGCFYNKQNEQPHLFKEKMIKKLNLDFFVEDNWDIVKYLSVKPELKKTRIFWIYNIFDNRIFYLYKYPDLKRAIRAINDFLEPKKKVLIVTDYFYPHWTGISKSLNYLTQALKDKFLFTILTVRYKKSLKQNEIVRDVRIIRENPISKISRAYYSLSLIWRFIKEVKNNDIIFINSPLTNILPVSILTKLFRKRLLIFHQGDLILPEGTLNRIIEKIFDLSSHISFLLANKVATYTLDYAQNSPIMKYYLDKFSPLPIPISNKRTKTKIKKMSQLKKQGKIIFGFAGRFVEEKGFDILLKAIPKVITKIPNAHFVFAGETNIAYENFFQKNLIRLKQVKKYVTLLGLLDNDKLQSFYQQIDFIVIPSRSDCFPLVQAEAMLYQKPAIVSDIPGARYLVKETGFGLIFNKENSDDLAIKITSAERQRSSLIKNYPKVLSILDNKKNAARIEEFIAN